MGEYKQYLYSLSLFMLVTNPARIYVHARCMFVFRGRVALREDTIWYPCIASTLYHFLPQPNNPKFTSSLNLSRFKFTPPRKGSNLHIRSRSLA